MAKIKFGSIVTDASGKLGGHVVGKQNGVHVLKNKSVSKNLNALTQQSNKSQTAFLMQKWSLLNDDERREWYLQIPLYKQINAFGDTFHYSGFALYQKLNQGRLNSNQSILSVPNDFNVPTFPQVLNITASLTSIIVQSDVYNSNDLIAIYATKTLSSGISKPTKFLRFLIVLTSAQLSAGYDVRSVYEEKFGTISVSSNIYFASKTYSSVSGYSNKVLTLSPKLTITSIMNTIDFTITDPTISGGVFTQQLLPAAGANKRLLVLGVVATAVNMSAGTGNTSLGIRFNGDGANLSSGIISLSAGGNTSMNAASNSVSRYIDVSNTAINVVLTNGVDQSFTGVIKGTVFYSEIDVS